jgi:hypothetical protein
MVDEWRPVKGYEGLYLVSSAGQIRSLDRVTHYAQRKSRLFKGQILQPTLSKLGRLSVCLCKDNIQKNKLVHVLVAEAFLGERPEWSDRVTHLNGDLADNRVANLKWADNSHSQRRRFAKYDQDGDLVSCAELAEKAGVPRTTFYRRLHSLGWTVERAMTTPARAYRRRSLDAAPQPQ